MEKSKRYKYTHFSVQSIKSAIDQLFSELTEDQKSTGSYRLERGDETWEYDDESEFFADYRKSHSMSHIRKNYENLSIRVIFNESMNTTVSVEADTRGKIEEVFEIFEQEFPKSKKEPKLEPKKEPIIFIGHGHSTQWRDLKDHLADKHSYKIEAYESGARAGHTIRDILEEMSTKSSFALLVMTGEDKDDSGTLKARQNVIHEVGLFQGKLGFARAIVLLENGTKEFSNINGIQQIRFSKGNIKETFGEVLATLKREFE